MDNMALDLALEELKERVLFSNGKCFRFWVSLGQVAGRCEMHLSFAHVFLHVKMFFGEWHS